MSSKLDLSIDLSVTLEGWEFFWYQLLIRWLKERLTP